MGVPLELVERAEAFVAAVRKFDQRRAFYRTSAQREEIGQLRLQWNLLMLELARLATRDPALAARLWQP